MAGETQLDPQSQQILDAVASRSRDLNAGADVHVPTGQEAVPTERVNPLDARKALFKKSNDRHQQDMKDGNAVTFDQLQQTLQPPPVPAADGQSPGMPARAAPQAPVATPGEPQYVTLTYQGRSVKVLQTDVQRAGGEELYLRRRQMADEATELAARRSEMDRTAAELDAERARLSALQADLQRPTAAPHDGAASMPASTAGTPTPAGDQGAQDLQARAKELAAKIYSGETEDAEQAIYELMMEGRRSAVSSEQVLQMVEQAVSRLQPPAAVAPTGGSGAPQPTEDPRAAEVRRQINEATQRDYPDVIGNEALRTQALRKYEELARDPANAERLLVDIALDACDFVKRNGQSPRQHVEDLKRGLPPSPSAGGTAPAASGEQTPMSNSAYVEMLARRRRGEQ